MTTCVRQRHRRSAKNNKPCSAVQQPQVPPISVSNDSTPSLQSTPPSPSNPRKKTTTKTRPQPQPGMQHCVHQHRHPALTAQSTAREKCGRIWAASPRCLFVAPMHFVRGKYHRRESSKRLGSEAEAEAQAGWGTVLPRNADGFTRHDVDEPQRADACVHAGGGTFGYGMCTREVLYSSAISTARTFPPRLRLTVATRHVPGVQDATRGLKCRQRGAEQDACMHMQRRGDGDGDGNA